MIVFILWLDNLEHRLVEENRALKISYMQFTQGGTINN